MMNFKDSRIRTAAPTRAADNEIRYPWDSAIRYRAVNEHCVRVEKGDKWGLFNRDAAWMDGPITFADPAFCRWVLTEMASRQPRLPQAA